MAGALTAQIPLSIVIDGFTLTCPGVKNVEHEYFYAVHGADDATTRGCLERTSALRRQFCAECLEHRPFI